MVLDKKSTQFFSVYKYFNHCRRRNISKNKVCQIAQRPGVETSAKEKERYTIS